MQSRFKNTRPRMGQCFLAAALVGLAGGISTSAISDEFTGPEVVVDNFAFSVVMPKASAPGSYLDIKIMGPHDEFVVNERVDGGVFDWVPSGPDGLYRYEAVLIVPATSKGESLGPNAGTGFERLRSYGTFEIRNGEVLPKQPAGDRQDNQLSAGERLLNSLLNALVPAAHAQDLTASSSGPSLRFDDTQDEDCTPAYDWRIEGQGGTSDADTNNFFRIIGVGEGSGPCAADITIVDLVHDGTDGATTSSVNSILVSASGDMNLANGSVFIDRSLNRLGIGTTAPLEHLHIVSVGNPRIRMEGGSSTWRLDPGSNGFWIWNDSSSTTPVKFENGSPTDSLVSKASTGNIGLGTANPDAPLHVLRSNGSAQVFVEDTGSTSPLPMFVLKNDGSIRFTMANTTGHNWAFSTGSAGFSISRAGTGPEMLVRNNGDVEISGDVTANGVLLTSSREVKTAFSQVDEHTILEKVAALDVSQWRYKHESGTERHIGPMAEDFQQVFGLGDGRHISAGDANGILFAAAKALKADNDAKDRRIAELEARMAKLEAMLD